MSIAVEPFTRGMGGLAAEIDADMEKVGLVMATADLLIGITALIRRTARTTGHFDIEFGKGWKAVRRDEGRTSMKPSGGMPRGRPAPGPPRSHR